MDSNHDIVPTLRMMDGAYAGLAADEIERLRARVVALERRSNTALLPDAVPTHRCKVCGAYWRLWDVDGRKSWGLCSRDCGECCDNVAMGDQIEALSSPVKVGALALTDGEFRDLVNKVTETARAFGQTQQLRERIRDDLECLRRSALTSPAKFDVGELRAMVSYVEKSHTGMLCGDEKRGGITDYTRGFGDCLAALKRRIDAVSSPAYSSVVRAALSADGGEDKRDAERYRWLRKRYIGFDFDWMADNDGNNGKQVICFEMDSGMRIGVDINDAIDAAIAANQARKGE